MLRMHFDQHLADTACEDALLDSTALRRFVDDDLGRERVPGATTLPKFRRLLEKRVKQTVGYSPGDMGAALML